MFDLSKDLDKYGGVPPYASELYGVYQPLLGWESRLTKKWIERGGQLFDPRIKRILDGWISPGPTTVDNTDPREWRAVPLDVGKGKSPYTVLLLKELNSELLNVLLPRVQWFVDNNDGRLPDGKAEWELIVNIAKLMEPQDGYLRQAEDALKERLYQELVVQAGGGQITSEMASASKARFLDLMGYESQIATFLLFHAEAQTGYDPNDLAKLFGVRKAPPLDDILRSSDPLANIDPNDRSGALSPVGFVHLFRQYFFNLGTFLGEPVEHVWLAPGTTIELVEVSTRRVLIERSLEEATESTTRAERSSSSKDELSDAVKEENDSSTKLGVTQSNTVNAYVYQGTVSASFGIENTRKDAREATHKQTREQTEKLSTELKQSVKSVFKQVSETTDTSSRRHVISNPTDNLLNYELRRKMRRVGVQLQDIGHQLCWQVFIDDPGVQLGLSELVHFAESPDLANLKEEEVPTPVSITSKVVVPIPFSPILDYTNNRANYEFAYVEPAGTQYTGKSLSKIKGDEDDDDSQTIMGPFNFKFDPPKSGYGLTPDIRVTGVQGNKIAVVRDVTPRTDGSFDMTMQRVNFGGENVINLDVEIVFAPQTGAFDDYSAKKKVAHDKYEAERDELLRKSFIESIRARIKDASNIRARPSWDLREEERTVVYRKLLERLMLDSWKLAETADTEGTRRLSHLRSEVVRALFDVDAMLYFVAPEWWVPRRRQGRLNLDMKVGDQTRSLTPDDVAMWGGEKRDSNYKITEESSAAKLGSSLGWLLQLDGDNLRNAFLNAPWVKAVIPIRPGRERGALNWLRSIEGHDDDGWDAPYLGGAPEDAEFAGKNIGEVLETIAERMEADSGIESVLEPDRVFETGFDHLAQGFDAGLAPNSVFSQWISVLPTDQIVAVEYQATDLLTPPP